MKNFRMPQKIHERLLLIIEYNNSSHLNYITIKRHRGSRGWRLLLKYGKTQAARFSFSFTFSSNFFMDCRQKPTKTENTQIIRNLFKTKKNLTKQIACWKMIGGVGRIMGVRCSFKVAWLRCQHQKAICHLVRGFKCICICSLICLYLYLDAAKLIAQYKIKQLQNKQQKNCTKI